MSFRFKQNAFTLAEVLITLSIIGITAALTVPSLVQKYQEKVLITKLKKFYSELSYAYNMNIAAENLDFKSDDILKFFKIYKICQNTYEECAPNKYTTLQNGNAQWGKGDSFANSSNYAVLQNGMILRYFSFNRTSGGKCELNAGSGALKNTCSEFSIDINGNKKPNQLGKDVFYFYITSRGVLPFGTKEETRYPFEGYCTKAGSTSCAAWVIENENMDYAKCSGLSWAGKRKCD